MLGTGARTGRFRRKRNRKESRFSGRVRVFFSSASSWAGRDVSRVANGGDSVSFTPYVGGAGGGLESDDGEHFDFNQPAEGQFLDRHAGTGGRILGEYFGVFRVDQREIRHVGNEHGGFDHVFDARPGCGEKGPDVLQALFRLGRDTFGELARGGIDAELSGAVQGLAGADGLGVRADAGASAVERMVFIVFSFGFL